jgi:hypothetical protein
MLAVSTVDFVLDAGAFQRHRGGISGLTKPASEEMPPNATFLEKPVSPVRLLQALKTALKVENQ